MTKLPRVASIKVKPKVAVTRRKYEWVDQGQGVLHLHGERPPSAPHGKENDIHGRPPYQWPFLLRRLDGHGEIVLRPDTADQLTVRGRANVRALMLRGEERS